MKKYIISGFLVLALSFPCFADNMGNLNVEKKADITAGSATTIPLTLKGASSQSARVFQVLDNSDNDLLYTLHTGHTFVTDGVQTANPQYGPGLWTHLYGEDTPEHTNQIGSYDHTGGANGERIFTKTSGDDFSQDDEDIMEVGCY